MLRLLNRFDNNVERAKVVLRNQKLLEFINDYTGMDLEGNRMSKHNTSTIYADRFVPKEEDEELWKLSEHVFDILYGPEEFDEMTQISPLEH